MSPSTLEGNDHTLPDSLATPELNAKKAIDEARALIDVYFRSVSEEFASNIYTSLSEPSGDNIYLFTNKIDAVSSQLSHKLANSAIQEQRIARLKTAKLAGEEKFSLLWFLRDYTLFNAEDLSRLLNVSANGKPIGVAKARLANQLNKIVSKTVTHYSTKFSSDLFALNLRFKSAGKLSKVEMDASPWTHDYMFDVFRLWFRFQSLTQGDEFILLSEYDKVIAQQCGPFYQRLNDLFVRYQILPGFAASRESAVATKPVLQDYARGILQYLIHS